ncbi:MarR family transcriptional regulator [Lysobacter oculi]|uniref:MarR family transcriptional regulator n=1 Tax=Solilutibacter oculi TaxID=2698682 RepID=A0A344J3M0_9GAMM|nr:MarR family transcriptional regulator [Lysobacter oculi]AXA83630.1 MarR family transcriptional regulator [Lysobacter oculi]
MNKPLPTCSGSSLGLLLRQVRDATRAALEAELARDGHNITLSQYITLKKLAEGEASPGELARAAELNPGAMTRLLDQLEKKDLLRRVPDPTDRRALRIELAEDARALIPAMLACADRVRARALAGMSEAEQDHFVRLLEQVRHNLTDEA